MSLKTDPNATFEMILPGDEKKAKEEQGILYFRSLTVRQEAELEDDFAQWLSVKGLKPGREKSRELLKKYLVGWKNIKDENGDEAVFDVDQIRFVFDSDLVTTIVARLPNEVSLNFSKRRTSDSQSESTSDKSAD